MSSFDGYLGFLTVGSIEKFILGSFFRTVMISRGLCALPCTLNMCDTSFSWPLRVALSVMLLAGFGLSAVSRSVSVLSVILLSDSSLVTQTTLLYPPPMSTSVVDAFLVVGFPPGVVRLC